ACTSKTASPPTRETPGSPSVFVHRSSKFSSPDLPNSPMSQSPAQTPARPCQHFHTSPDNSPSTASRRSPDTKESASPLQNPPASAPTPPPSTSADRPSSAPP